jgi:carboxylesterase type B
VALSYGPPPPQGGHFGMDALSQDAAGDDWLTVNVWSPEPDPGAGLPVMVWIHGGAYVIGMSGLPEYDGGRLARDGGVVVVTFNYRVGIEGFAQIEGAPPNRGLLDQVAALEWVRDNIRAFGGDPDRVAVFGQSAGGGSVAALLAMDRAAGLFRRAVAQSAPGTFFSPELAADITAACAAELGLRPTVADLSSVAPRQLSAAADTVGAKMDQWAQRWGRPAHRTILFSPVDGEVLAVTPWQALTDGAGRDIELLVGHTRDEQQPISHHLLVSARRPPWHAASHAGRLHIRKICVNPGRRRQAPAGRPDNGGYLRAPGLGWAGLGWAGLRQVGVARDRAWRWPAECARSTSGVSWADRGSSRRASGPGGRGPARGSGPA